MKLAQINLTRGFYIPGIGETMKLVNVEVDETPAGYLVTTPTAKVIVPWGCVAPSVVEFVPLTVAKLPPEAVEAARSQSPGDVKLVGLAEIAAGAQAHGTGMFAHVERSPQEWKDGLGEQLAAAQGYANQQAQAQAAAPIPQPPPPQKRGGRK